MASRPRRNHAPAFKAQVALAALKGDKTLADRHSAFTRKAPLIQGVSLSKQSEPPLGTGLGARRQVVEQVGGGGPAASMAGQGHLVAPLALAIGPGVLGTPAISFRKSRGTAPWI